MKKIILLFIFLLVFGLSISAQKPIKDLKPTVVLISLDGFRPDYLDKYKPPNLNELAKKGVRAKWLIPSFPTKTFPNHYTIATGLYPDHHGIIENNVYDAEFDAEFHLNERDEVQNPRWWGGEPIWVTAEKQGQIAASYFFPGTETPISGVRPTFWKEYDGDIPNNVRVDTVLSWFDLPVGKRPTIYTMYFSDTDDAGHRYTPDSEKTKDAVLNLDQTIGRFIKGLKKRKIDKKVNIIIVSDHGMAAYNPRDAIILDEMFDTDLAERIFWVGEFTQIFPKPGKEDEIYNQIKSNLPPNAEVYRRGEFPERFHFGTNKRIAPIVVVPHEGSKITNRADYEKDKSEGKLEELRGSHGFDNQLPSMRALFIARGAAFKNGFVAEPFENIQIYNLMSFILGLKPAANDGNLNNVRGMLRNSANCSCR